MLNRLFNTLFGKLFAGFCLVILLTAAGVWMAAYSAVRLKAFREGGRTVYDTIDNRRRRLGLAA